MSFTSFIGNVLREAYDPKVIHDNGFTEGAVATRLVMEEEFRKREYDLLCRGAELERQRTLQEMENTIEEISAEEFAELAEIDKEPFGFVGTLDDLSLVIDGEVV